MEYLSIWTVIFVVFISTWASIWNGDAVEKLHYYITFITFTCYPFLLSIGLLSLPLMQLRKLHDYITLITFSSYIFLLSIVCYHSPFFLFLLHFYFLLIPNLRRGCNWENCGGAVRGLLTPYHPLGGKCENKRIFGNCMDVSNRKDPFQKKKKLKMKKISARSG